MANQTPQNMAICTQLPAEAESRACSTASETDHTVSPTITETGTPVDSKSKSLVQVQCDERLPSPVDGSGAPTLHGNGEKPKQLFRSPWIRLLRTVAQHIPALSVGILLICINSLGLFWFEADLNLPVRLPTTAFEVGADNVLNLLQIAAKVQEVLVIFSLTTIAVDIYQRLLVTEGVPFGMISSCYRVGNLSYLRHSGLYASFSWRRGTMMLGSFIIFSTIVALLAGPATAILLIPRPGWFELQGDFAKNMPPIYYSRTFDYIWPRVLNTTVFRQSLEECVSGNAVLHPSCPAAGFKDIYTWVLNWPANGLEGNFTMQATTVGSDTRRRMLAAHADDDSATYATTLSSVTVSSIGAYHDYTRSVDVGRISRARNVRIRTTANDATYQPLTQTRCQVFDHEEATAGLEDGNLDVLPYWPMDGIECFDDARCSSWQQRDRRSRLVDTDLWDSRPVRGDISFQWVETEGPLSAIFKIPYVQNRDGSQRNPLVDPSATKQAFYIVTCSFPARWVSSSTTAALAVTDVIESNVTASSFPVGSDTDMARMGFPVQLTKDWADLLHASTENTTTLGFNEESSAVEGLLATLVGMLPDPSSNRTLSFFLPPGSKIIQKLGFVHIIERVLGVFVTDGMSRVGLSRNWELRQAFPCTMESFNVDRIQYTVLINDGGNSGYPNTGYVRSDDPSHPSEYFWTDSDGSAIRKPQEETMEEMLTFMNKWKKYEVVVEQFGYGSGIASPTLTFGIVIVSIYIAAIAAHMLISTALCIYSATSSKDSAWLVGIWGWNDVQELIALAWKSNSPAHLDNVGAGISPFSRVWKQNVTVRVNEDNCMELVSDAGGQLKEPRRDEFYG